MTVKDRIIERIKSITNPDILNEILDLISAESEIEDLYLVTPEQRKNIEEGMQEFENGNTYSQEESNQIVSLWFQEKFGGQIEQ